MDATLKSILSELTSIKSKLDKVDSMEVKLDNMQLTLNTIAAENVELKKDNRDLKKALAEKDNTIKSLQSGLDQIERHQRSYSIRVLNMPLSDREERNPLLTMKKLYDNLFLPILRGAHQEGDLETIPQFDQLFETAHVLPGKGGYANKPIIARFYNRNLKSLCFRHRKAYAPRNLGPTSGLGNRGAGRALEGEEPTKFLYPFHDDLTKPTLALMKTLQAHSDVQACWSINGQLRFKLKNSLVVKKVQSVFDSVENILK